MRHLNALLLSALLLTATSCMKEVMERPHSDTHLANINTSDCIMHTDMLAAKDLALDSISVTLTNGSLSVTHYNMMLDCSGGNNIVTSMEMLGDTITVIENVGEQGLTDCLCLYNNSFQIVDPPSGLFTLVIKEVYSYLGNTNQRIVYQHQFYN